MSSTVVGKDASQRTGSEIYFKTYQKLMKQKVKLDRELAKVQTKLLRPTSRNSRSSAGLAVKYVLRLDNDMPLIKAIRESMTPDKEMKMKDIINSLLKNGLYHTDSKYLYTMINNKLNRDKQIKKVRRGVFMIKPHHSRAKPKSVA